MKQIVAIALLLAAAVLVAQQGPAITLPQLEIGMQKEQAIAALSRTYELRKVWEDWWWVLDRDTKRKVGDVHFEDNQVGAVSRALTDRKVASETVQLVSELIRIVRPFTKPEVVTTSGERRKASVVLRVADFRVPAFDEETLFLDFGDGKSVVITLHRARDTSGAAVESVEVNETRLK